MVELINRANIVRKLCELDGEEVEVFIYEDHRYLLNILYFARYSNTLDEVPNLVYFDRHDDGAIRKKLHLNSIRKHRDQFSSLEDFWKLVEFKLSGLDDDWLFHGMDLNLIRNCILFNKQENNNFNRYVNSIYQDVLGTEHYVFENENFASIIQNDGWLFANTGDEFENIRREIIGWDLRRA